MSVKFICIKTEARIGGQEYTNDNKHYVVK